MKAGRSARPRGAGKRAAKRPAEPQVEWTERALTDLEAIGDHIARDKPLVAERLLAKLLLAAQSAAVLPLAGRRVPEIGRDDIREVLVKRYRIVYVVTAPGISVITVFEGHRLFPRDVDLPRE